MIWIQILYRGEQEKSIISRNVWMSVCLLTPRVLCLPKEDIIFGKGLELIRQNCIFPKLLLLFFCSLQAVIDNKIYFTGEKIPARTLEKQIICQVFIKFHWSKTEDHSNLLKEKIFIISQGTKFPLQSAADSRSHVKSPLMTSLFEFFLNEFCRF